MSPSHHVSMKKAPMFKSARKLRSLPIGSRVTWRDPNSPFAIYGAKWTKVAEDRWSDGGSFMSSFPYTSDQALGYNANRPFWVVRVGPADNLVAP